MNRRWVSVIFLALAASASPADTGRIGRAPEFVGRVNDAIDRGVAWLKQTQAADGSFSDVAAHPGAPTAIAYHTMRVCGVPRDDPAAVAAWTALRRGYRREDLGTYSAALYLMAIASHGEPVAKAADDRDVKLSAEDAEFATEIARCLAGGQGSDGTWSYEVDVRAGSRPGGITGGHGPNGGDHSNTQYALLGLKSAARCGIAIDPSVWKASLVHFLAAQEQKGPEVARDGGAAPNAAWSKDRTAATAVDRARGWSYTLLENVKGRQGAYASMTAAGVSSAVICRSELFGTQEMTAKLEAESEQSVWDGLAWLGTNWGRAGAPRHRGVRLDFYESYGVERAGVLAGVEWMSSLDWYGAGAPPLLDAQSADGSWSAAGVAGHSGAQRGKGARASDGDLIDTCFALLFLRKGTTPVRRGAVVLTGGDDLNFAVAATLTGKDLDDFVDVVLSRWRRSSDDDVRRRLFDGATSAGPRIVEPLLLRMDSPDAAARAAAHALLVRATGRDFGYDAAGSADLRDAAVVKWQTWWMESKDRLVYDAAARRLAVR